MLETSLKTIAVVSAEDGEGKSTIIANLGIAFAQSGQRVLLVDGNLQRPFFILSWFEEPARLGKPLKWSVTGLQEVIWPTLFVIYSCYPVVSSHLIRRNC